MKLNVLERMMLLNVLPREGSFVTLKVVADLRDELSFSEAGHKKYKFVEDEGRVTWNPAAEQFKEVHIGEKATDVVVEALKKLDKEKKLTMEHMSLFQKFVEGNKK